MTIGIDVRALMEGRTTGVQVYIVNLLHSLFKLDRKNDYILFANSYGKTVLPAFEYPNVSRVITRYPNKIFNFFQKFFAFPKIDKLLRGVDLFFSPHWRAVALSKKIPLVITVHDLSYELFPEFFTLRQRLWHRLMDYRQAARVANKIIAVSRGTKRDVEKIYNVEAGKIEVIYSGVSLSRGASRLKAPERYFLYFGTFEPRKNLDNLLEAYKKYHSVSRSKKKLVLAGSRGWKTDLTVPVELKDSIRVFRDVSEDDKARLYRGAYAFLFLSFYEGFGFPILEAAAAGAPVICSFAASLAEVGKSFALFVNPLRPAQTAKAMTALENDRELYESLKAQGLLAARKFNWENTAARTLSLFESVAGGKDKYDA